LCKFDDAQNHLEQAMRIAEDHFDKSIDSWAIKKTDILEKMGSMKRRQGYVHESLELLSQCVDLKCDHYGDNGDRHPGKYA